MAALVVWLLTCAAVFVSGHHWIAVAVLIGPFALTIVYQRIELVRSRKPRAELEAVMSQYGMSIDRGPGVSARSEMLNFLAKRLVEERQHDSNARAIDVLAVALVDGKVKQEEPTCVYMVRDDRGLELRVADFGESGGTALLIYSNANVRFFRRRGGETSWRFVGVGGHFLASNMAIEDLTRLQGEAGKDFWFPFGPFVGGSERATYFGNRGRITVQVHEISGGGAVALIEFPPDGEGRRIRVRFTQSREGEVQRKVYPSLEQGHSKGIAMHARDVLLAVQLETGNRCWEIPAD